NSKQELREEKKCSSNVIESSNIISIRSSDAQEKITRTKGVDKIYAIVKRKRYFQNFAMSLKVYYSHSKSLTGGLPAVLLDQAHCWVPHKQTISDFLNDIFFFSADNEFIYRNQNGTVILRNVETNNSTVLIENKKIVSLKAVRYEVSPDREYALFAFNVEPVSK
ncbi:hypothetical protein CIB84_000093, partial [Bambusicola thoracicus]